MSMMHSQKRERFHKPKAPMVQAEDHRQKPSGIVIQTFTIIA